MFISDGNTGARKVFLSCNYNTKKVKIGTEKGLSVPESKMTVREFEYLYSAGRISVINNDNNILLLQH